MGDSVIVAEFTLCVVTLGKSVSAVPVDVGEIVTCVTLVEIVVGTVVAVLVLVALTTGQNDGQSITIYQRYS